MNPTISSKEHFHELLGAIGLMAVGSNNTKQCLLPKKKDRVTRLIKKVILCFRD